MALHLCRCIKPRGHQLSPLEINQVAAKQAHNLYGDSAMSNTNQTSKKSTRKIIPITVKVGDVVKGTVAKVRHPEPGVLIQIEGQPMAFLPNSTAMERRR